MARPKSNVKTKGTSVTLPVELKRQLDILVLAGGYKDFSALIVELGKRMVEANRELVLNVQRAIETQPVNQPSTEMFTSKSPSEGGGSNETT